VATGEASRYHRLVTYVNLQAHYSWVVSP
jgi:hypothetical protein